MVAGIIIVITNYYYYHHHHCHDHYYYHYYYNQRHMEDLVFSGARWPMYASWIAQPRQGPLPFHSCLKACRQTSS